MSRMTHKPQEPPLDAPESCCHFQPSGAKPFLATASAVARFETTTIQNCLLQLQQLASQHDGIDYLQVFQCDETGDRLWFIEDGDGGAITALLPEDY